MKKTAIALIMIAALALTACGATRIVHCDDCGVEIKVSDDKITEDWILFCEKCAPAHEQVVLDMLNEK